MGPISGGSFQSPPATHIKPVPGFLASKTRSGFSGRQSTFFSGFLGGNGRASLRSSDATARGAMISLLDQRRAPLVQFVRGFGARVPREQLRPVLPKHGHVFPRGRLLEHAPHHCRQVLHRLRVGVKRCLPRPPSRSNWPTSPPGTRTPSPRAPATRIPRTYSTRVGTPT